MQKVLKLWKKFVMLASHSHPWYAQKANLVNGFIVNVVTLKDKLRKLALNTPENFLNLILQWQIVTVRCNNILSPIIADTLGWPENKGRLQFYSYFVFCFALYHSFFRNFFWQFASSIRKWSVSLLLVRRNDIVET